MPRGFLIKRKKEGASSWQSFIRSEDESVPEPLPPINADVDVETNGQGSPDSGYARSPSHSGSAESGGFTWSENSNIAKFPKYNFVEESTVKDNTTDENSSIGTVGSDNEEKSENGTPDRERKGSEEKYQDPNGNNIFQEKLKYETNLSLIAHMKDGQRRLADINANRTDQMVVLNSNYNIYRNGLYRMPPMSTPLSSSGNPGYFSGSHPQLSINPAIYGSPYYWAAFNRLALSSPHNKGVSPIDLKSPGQYQPERKDSGINLSPVKGISPGKRKMQQTPSGDKPKLTKKPKSARKITFEDEWKSSPVSGTYIRDDKQDSNEDGIRVVSGDIDSSMNCVEITPEAEAELAKIENKIGDYICKLCKEFYENAFELAQHRCSRIVHIEYRCPECDKVFNCPANLASHRRWHKPRGTTNSKQHNPLNLTTSQHTIISPNGSEPRSPTGSNASDEVLYECEKCGKKFRRQTYLRKHMVSHTVQPIFSCSFCNKQMKSEAARAKHIMIDHAVSTPKLPFLDKSNTEGYHGNDLFSCKYCNGTFFSAYGLGRHMDKFHTHENRQNIPFQLLQLNRPC